MPSSAARLAARAVGSHRELPSLADDPDARVRLRAAVALGGLDTDAAREALARLAARDGDSPWAASAILGGVGADPLRFLSTLAARQPAWLTSPTPVQARFLSGLAELIGERGIPAEVDSLIARANGARDGAAAFAMLGGLARGQSRLKSPRLTWTGPESKRFPEARDAARDPDRPAWPACWRSNSCSRPGRPTRGPCCPRSSNPTSRSNSRPPPRGA